MSSFEREIEFVEMERASGVVDLGGGLYAMPQRLDPHGRPEPTSGRHCFRPPSMGAWYPNPREPRDE